MVDFYATWCGPCKQIAPKVADMARSEEFQGVDFFKVDVDELAEVSENEQIQGMPTFKIFKNGVIQDTLVGPSIDTLKQKVKKAMG